MKKLYYFMILAILLLPACTQEEEMPKPEEVVINEPAPDEKETEKVKDGEEEVEFGVFAEGYTHEAPEWESLKKDIEAQTDETLTSLAMPASADDTKLLYVSTSGDYNQATQKQVNKIYSYHMNDKQLTELYKEEEDRVLRTMGREDDRLIVLLDNIDNNPGPCASGWYESYQYSTLDLESSVFSLTAFSLPKYLIELGQEKDKKCREENSLNG